MYPSNMSSSWVSVIFCQKYGTMFSLLRSMRPPMLHRTMGQETHRIQCIMGAPRLRGHFLASSTSEEKVWKTQVFKGNSTKNKDSGTLSHTWTKGCLFSWGPLKVAAEGASDYVSWSQPYGFYSRTT